MNGRGFVGSGCGNVAGAARILAVAAGREADARGDSDDLDHRSVRGRARRVEFEAGVPQARRQIVQ